MQHNLCRASDVEPLLFRHAAPRISSDDLPGHYDTEEQLWVVETSQGPLPLIAAPSTAQLETSTSTRVRQEGDDDDATNESHCLTLLDTSTFTKVRQESADDDLSTERSLGAISPARMIGAILELETRSYNNQEGIDEDWPSESLDIQPYAVPVRKEEEASAH